jgi:hypothetical protein
MTARNKSTSTVFEEQTKPESDDKPRPENITNSNIAADITGNTWAGLVIKAGRTCMLAEG